MDPADCERIAFRAYDDAVRRSIPTMNLCMLGEVILPLAGLLGLCGAKLGRR